MSEPLVIPRHTSLPSGGPIVISSNWAAGLLTTLFLTVSSLGPRVVCPDVSRIAVGINNRSNDSRERANAVLFKFFFSPLVYQIKLELALYLCVVILLSMGFGGRVNYFAGMFSPVFA
jgi:hypothetical protein